MLIEPLDPDVRRLGREIIEALEQSQSEIGEILHDTICQTLTGAALMASVLASRAAAGEAPRPGELGKISAMLERSLDGARGLMHQFQPLQDGPTALMRALEQLAADTGATAACEFRCEEPVLLDDPAAGLTLYRIAASAVRNAFGRAPAGRIQIALTAGDGTVEMSVSTEGAGASADAQSRRLKLMRYRAEAAGVTLRHDSQPDGGVVITCALRTVPRSPKPG
jgi:signal transduction histidine kinase